MEHFPSIIIFILGAMVGSFLNVCIVRMPQEKSVIFPRSHCVHCKKQIPWYDNIPFVSFLLLRGRCRFCHERISFRYFVVELVTALLFLAIYYFFGLQWILIPYFVLVAGLIAASFIDIEHRIIPDEISLGGIVVGLIFSFLLPEMHYVSSRFQSLGLSVIGVLVGGGAIYLIGIIGDLIFKKESMGGGDVKLLAMIGAFLGWKAALLTFFIAPFFGAVYGIIEKIRTKDTAIAYGPFLVLGSLICLFWGNEIIDWIMRGYGLY